MNIGRFFICLMLVSCGGHTSSHKPNVVSPNDKEECQKADENVGYLMGIDKPIALSRIEKETRSIHWKAITHWMTPLFGEGIEYDGVLHASSKVNDSLMYKYYLAIVGVGNNAEVKGVRIVRYDRSDDQWRVSVLKSE